MDEKVREIEERNKRLEGHWRQREDIKYLLSCIRELVEGIEKHRMNTWGYGEDVDGKMWQVENDIDEKLYKLIEKEKP